MRSRAQSGAVHNKEHHNSDHATPGRRYSIATRATDAAHTHTDDLVRTNGHIHSSDHDDSPPSKRRKFASPVQQPTSLSRPVSPPWKRIAVEGPTSFVEGGRRKSSRTNLVPLELQPQSDKRRTRSTIQKPQASKSRYGGAALAASQVPQATTASPKKELKRPQSSGRPSGTPHLSGKTPARTESAKAPRLSTSKQSPSKHSPSRRRHTLGSYNDSPTRRKPGRPSSSSHVMQTRLPGRPRITSRVLNFAPSTEDEDMDEDDQISGWSSPDSEQRALLEGKRLKFKVKMPQIPLQSFGNMVPPRKYQSFEAYVESDGFLSGEDGRRISEEDAKREARLRNRLLDAAEPGGLLSREMCSLYLTEPQEEPDRQYAHQDHLVSQALHFRKLMALEHKHHVTAARKLAHWCATAWKKKQPLSEEEIEREYRDVILARYRQLRKDLMSKWDIVTAEVQKRRLAKWEEEQEILGKQALNQMLEQSTMLLDARRVRRESDATSASVMESDLSGADGEDEDSSDEDESNMSTSGTDDSAEIERASDDEGLTVEELRQKYAAIPDSLGIVSPQARRPKPPRGDHLGTGEVSKVLESSRQSSPEHSGLVAVETDEVDEMLIDDSDESTDMEDDMGDSDEGQSSDDESGEESADHSDADQKRGLLGFFSNTELEAPGIEEVAPDGTALGDDLDLAINDKALALRGESTLDLYPQPGDPSSETSPGTVATTKPSEIDSASSVEMHPESHGASLTTTPQPSHYLKTPVPFLLRGTLREYQHYGLDWLAGLYANGTNGILADEMGLGKTIQTIALLAHLACHHEIWGPHLIIVPTSVMLNWEMEFKKFLPGFKVLTYYGNQEERKRLRIGWTDDDKWHVWITSYQIVLQDHAVFKRRQWHYMVLDEAHNIKNFRSKRWQTLLTFKTKARLLLTGTPLQNNLTELWSLLFFLMPSDGTDSNVGGFADLQEFSEWFRKPVEQILENGRETMDDEAKTIVAKLHRVLRPFLLRRLKADVEKQMPGKYEHVVLCRLSKRQRFLYDGFMSMTQTRETLASGNYLSIINCLMQLRKVCNHPDLFETRQIVTSFAMPRAAVADYEINEFLVRRRLLSEDPLSKVSLDFLNLTPTASEDTSQVWADESARLSAIRPLQDLCKRQFARVDWEKPFDASTIQAGMASLENGQRMSRLEELRHCVYLNHQRRQRRPIYGQGRIDKLTFEFQDPSTVGLADCRYKGSDQYLNTSDIIRSMVPTVTSRSEDMEPIIRKFACITPAVVATEMPTYALTNSGISVIQDAQQVFPEDPFHESRMRLSIAFPDKRLLQYDCGKLQRLDALLRTLRAGNHRALIFTQMTKVLDILEAFLNIHGHRYLRLDGTTKIEQRQILTDRFNNDDRILAFILSSRSGGLGINLTGADTVIFYDLDWNPAMDKQCQDRCHRIGQTRDVHIYRFVSEHTIEANILRKANQKRMLDDVVIQEGEFTTDYFNKLDVRDVLGHGDELAEAKGENEAAIDRVLDVATRGPGGYEKVLEQVEDREDILAAKQASKEIYADAVDFEEQSRPRTPATPATPAAQGDTIVAEEAADGQGAGEAEAEDEAEPGHVDEFMLRFVEWELRGVPVAGAADKSKGKKGKRGHGDGKRKGKKAKM